MQVNSITTSDAFDDILVGGLTCDYFLCDGTTCSPFQRLENYTSKGEGRKRERKEEKERGSE